MQLMISGNRECQKGGLQLAQRASRWQHPGGKPISAIALEFLWGGGRRALRCQPTGGLAWNVLSPPRGAPASLLTPGARELGFHAMAGQTLAIADDGRSDWIVRRRKDGTAEITIDHEDVSRSRLRVNSRRWLLSKVPPCLYGDRPEEFSDLVRGHFANASVKDFPFEIWRKILSNRARVSAPQAFMYGAPEGSIFGL
jgi:Bacteriophage Sf6, terminase small subunit-like